MGVSDELVWLLHQIRSTASPVERLKLLARGWRSVRELSASDRKRLARELGFDGAEELIEQLAHRGGMSPATLLARLHEAEQADPAVVLDNIRGLAEPHRRGKAAGEIFDTVSEILVDAEAPGPHERTASGEPTEGAEAEHAPPTPSPQTPVREETSAPAVTAAGDESGPASLGARPDGGEPGAARPGDPSVRPPAATARPRPAAAEMPGARQAAEPAPPRTGIAHQPALAAATVAPAAPSVAGLATQLGAEASLLRRLRLLASSAQRLENAGIDELRAVLECFPAGWARRRALQRLLEAGVPRSTADAIALLETLARPSERLWAATTLTAARRLDDREREALLAAVPSPALRRRLKARLGESRG